MPLVVPEVARPLLVKGRKSLVKAQGLDRNFPRDFSEKSPSTGLKSPIYGNFCPEAGLWQSLVSLPIDAGALAGA
jgi:hypothetical protein